MSKGTMVIYPLKVSRFMFKNYCYLAVDSNTKEALLIDPAWEIDKIEQQLISTEGVLKAILLTHHHMDHVNLAEHLAQKYQVPVLMSKVEIEYYGFSCKNLMPIRHSTKLSFGVINVLPLLTPGHTKGAICYWIGNALFTGDTLFTEGCGVCSSEGSNAQEMFDSIHFLKEIVPLETKIYPGHSFGEEPGKSFAYLLQNNIYLHFTKQEEFVAFRMRKNQKGLMAFK